MNTREKAMVDSRDLPSTATEKQAWNSNYITKFKFYDFKKCLNHDKKKNLTLFEDSTHCEY